MADVLAIVTSGVHCRPGLVSFHLFELVNGDIVELSHNLMVLVNELLFVGTTRVISVLGRLRLGFRLTRLQSKLLLVLLLMLLELVFYLGLHHFSLRLERHR